MPSEPTSPLVVLAAGGTGGHIFPAEALARALLKRGIRVALVTDRRGGEFSSELEVPVHRIAADTLRPGIIGKLRGIFAMGLGLMQAREILRKIHPTAVVGFGGYPSVPTVLAASQLRIPIVLHEQNAVLGRANRVLMSQAKAIATSFPHVAGLKQQGNARIMHTGNPVRPAISFHRVSPYPTPAAEGPLHLLVMGGSQGARIFSQVVPQALGQLPDDMRRRVTVAQQCRKEDLEDARTAFAAAGMDAELSPFFKDAPERMAKSHLVICRAGASTIAELTAMGRPAILVPYPFGHADEQTANAEAVAEAGGGWLIPQSAFTPEALAVRLEALLAMPSTLQKTADAARGWGMPEAAENLADCVCNVLGVTRSAGAAATRTAA